MEAADRRAILLEVCTASVDDCVTAERGGADRVELNAGLELGGLTPSLGTLIAVRQAVQIPVIVMIRPRAGGFCYGDADFAVMARDVELAIAHGADGVAFGVLHEDGRVDGVRNARLIELAGKREVVFHRAFDVTPDPSAALEQLIALGVRRVLTSGQEPTAQRGADLIARLIGQAAGRIELLPGAGINRDTVADVLARTGCNQVHASLRRVCIDPSTAARPDLSFGVADRAGGGLFGVTNADSVREMRALLDSQPPAE